MGIIKHLTISFAHSVFITDHCHETQTIFITKRPDLSVFYHSTNIGNTHESGLPKWGDIAIHTEDTVSGDHPHSTILTFLQFGLKIYRQAQNMNDTRTIT